MNREGHTIVGHTIVVNHRGKPSWNHRHDVSCVSLDWFVIVGLVGFFSCVRRLRNWTFVTEDFFD